MKSARPFRISLDVNVWLAYLIGLNKGRTGTAPMEIVRMVTDMRIGRRPLQLVIAKETISTLQRVATDYGVPIELVAELVNGIILLARSGPEALDPFVYFGREVLQMRDQEDAGVLASAIIARADLLLTDNLQDFRSKDAQVIDTGSIPTGGGQRAMYCIIYERADGVAVVVAHPIDFLHWVRNEIDLSPSGLRDHYGAPTSTPVN